MDYKWEKIFKYGDCLKILLNWDLDSINTIQYGTHNLFENTWLINVQMKQFRSKNSRLS